MTQKKINDSATTVKSAEQYQKRVNTDQNIISITPPTITSDNKLAQKPPQRQRPAIITLTPRAEERVKELLNSGKQEGNEVLGLRIGVKSRGCTGLSYTFDYVAEIEKGAEVVLTSQGDKVIIDSKAFLYLIGSQLDYVEEGTSSRFIFINPNAKGMCGCGESFHV